MEEIYLGAGCFWGSEAYFQRVKGVVETEVGYGGGFKENPTYEEVKYGDTGHVELVRVVFDGQEAELTDIIDHFFTCHDPTQRNRQGEDVGSQYKSAVFYVEDGQRDVVEYKKKEWQDREKDKEVVTQILPFKNFYRAEEYHQKYAQKNGGSCSIF